MVQSLHKELVRAIQQAHLHPVRLQIHKYAPQHFIEHAAQGGHLFLPAMECRRKVDPEVQVRGHLQEATRRGARLSRARHVCSSVSNIQISMPLRLGARGQEVDEAEGREIEALGFNPERRLPDVL